MSAVTEKKGSHKFDEMIRKMDSLSGLEKQGYSRTLTAEEKQIYLDYCKDRDLVMVTGVFKCLEPLGGSLVMSARPWPGHEFKYTFQHGKEYIVPRCIAIHLEKGCFWDEHSYLLDAQGKPIVGTGKRNHRFSFNTSDLR